MTASTSSKNNKSLIQSQIHQWVMCALVALMMITTNIFIVTDAFAEEPVSKSRRGVAIGSHDTVAYHSLSRDPHAKAVAGKKSWVVEYLGAKWRFASKESADLFKANPEKYKPAYNGYW